MTFLSHLRLRGTALVLICVAAQTSHATWRAGEDGRWTGEAGGWRFTVDPARARLIEAAPAGGRNVLLRGGHRVWLGPQSEWPKFWPPPSDWESARAESVDLSQDGRVLRVRLPRSDERFPALVRLYRLEEDGLDLGAQWESAGKSYQLIQILQVRPDAVATLRLVSTESAPAGFGLLPLAKRPGLILDASRPAQLRRGGDADAVEPPWELFFDGVEEKLGVAPQVLRVRFPEGTAFDLEPARFSSAMETGPAPDAGLFTHIYLGAQAWAMMEVEQLSPRLTPAAGEREVEVWVKLRTAASPRDDATMAR